METVIIKGQIIFPAERPAAPCKVFIRLLDTSLSDAPAKMIAECSLDYSAAGLSPAGSLQFELRAQARISPTADYSLFVHVDADHDGNISAGDWMHDRLYPVRSGEEMGNMTIRLKKVE